MRKAWKIALVAVFALLVFWAVGSCLMFVLRVASMAAIFGTPEEHLEKFETSIKSACRADSLRNWADEMVTKFPEAEDRAHSFSSIPTEQGFEPLRRLTNAVPAYFDVRYDQAGKPKQVDVVWLYGRLIEGVSVFTSSEAGKSALKERGTYSTEIAPRVFVWQTYTR